MHQVCQAGPTLTCSALAAPSGECFHAAEMWLLQMVVCQLVDLLHSSPQTFLQTDYHIVPTKNVAVIRHSIPGSLFSCAFHLEKDFLIESQNKMN